MDYVIKEYRVYVEKIGHNGGLIPKGPYLFGTEEETIDFAKKSRKEYDTLNVKIEKVCYGFLPLEEDE